LVPGIVLVAIDLARLAILLAIDLGFFLRSQLATVGLTVGMHFLIDLRLIVFQVGRFAGGQLAALDALRDAVLLVFFAIPNRHSPVTGVDAAVELCAVVLLLCATTGDAKSASAAVTKVIFRWLLIRISRFSALLLICPSTLCGVSEKKHGE
jgi:hypothetical protein